jgi:hypothetical protein
MSMKSPLETSDELEKGVATLFMGVIGVVDLAEWFCDGVAPFLCRES